MELGSLLVENIDEPKALKLFPNPVADKFTLEVNEKITTPFILSIKNVNGKEVFHKTYPANDSVHLDISNFSSGIYLLEVISDDFKWVEKLIKE